MFLWSLFLHFWKHVFFCPFSPWYQWYIHWVSQAKKLKVKILGIFMHGKACGQALYLQLFFSQYWLKQGWPNLGRCDCCKLICLLAKFQNFQVWCGPSMPFGFINKNDFKYLQNDKFSNHFKTGIGTFILTQIGMLSD